MSEKKKSVCKTCGRPSETVVCMHCFFNYEYSSYTGIPSNRPKRPLTQRQKLAHQESIQKKESENAGYTSIWEQDWIDEPIKETEPKSSQTIENPSEDSNSQPKNPSWYSRLSRF